MIFEKWKETANRKDHKKLEKEFGTKGAVFTTDAISAAEYVVPPALKGAAIYYSIKKSVAPAKGKDEDLVMAPRVSRTTFYEFKSASVIKDNWKGDEKVPMYNTITPVPCKSCSGKGYSEDKCKSCKGSGKIEDSLIVLEGEKQEKQKKTFSYPCAECYGTGKIQFQCKECGGHKNLYKYEILPVPFKAVVTGLPVLHSSLQTKYEKEIGKDLQDLIEQVEGIKFSNFRDLEDKAEASLGYWDKDVKRTVSIASNDYKSYEKDKSVQIVSQIYLFPMIQLNCKTKRGTKYEIYSIGSEAGFTTFSNF